MAFSFKWKCSVETDLAIILVLDTLGCSTSAIYMHHNPLSIIAVSLTVDLDTLCCYLVGYKVSL